VSTEANCVLACCAGLSEDRELLDPIEDREAGNASGRAERPCWSDTKLARRHTGLDALADGEFCPDWIEHDGGAMHDTEHPPAELAAVAIECDPVDCGYRAVVD
jgi:hypothetical protein